MKYDIVIKGGTLLDPALKLSAVADIAVKENKIVEIHDNIRTEAELTIQAAGQLVLPGLIDFHTHVFFGGTDIGVSPDMSFLPQGVTAAVDAGSAGTANYRLFSSSVIANSIVRIKAYLNVCPTGLGTTKYHENVSPAYYDQRKLSMIVEEFGDEILGLKIRSSKELVEAEGLEPLRQTIALAEHFGLPVVVHTTNPPEEAGEIAKLLRPGDIFAHVYHGTGHSIINSDGTVCEAIKKARARGVIFDAANGGNHWVFAVAKAAMADSFYPDIISTDITAKTLYKPPVYGLPYIMSKYLTMGMDLMSVIEACTSTPARLMNMAGRIGTLQPGAYADIAIFNLMDVPVRYLDTKKEAMIGNQLLVPLATIKGGQLVYKSIGFNTM